MDRPCTAIVTPTPEGQPHIQLRAHEPNQARNGLDLVCAVATRHTSTTSPLHRIPYPQIGQPSPDPIHATATSSCADATKRSPRLVSGTQPRLPPHHLVETCCLRHLPHRCLPRGIILRLHSTAPMRSSPYSAASGKLLPPRLPLNTARSCDEGSSSASTTSIIFDSRASTPPPSPAAAMARKA